MTEFTMNRVNDIRQEVLEGDNLFRFSYFLTESRIFSTFLLPNVLVGPSVDHSEPFHEKDA